MNVWTVHQKNGYCREVAISGVSVVVMILLFHSPVTFDQISNSFLVIVLKESTSLTIWTENQAVYLLSEACNRFLIHSSIQGF